MFVVAGVPVDKADTKVDTMACRIGETVPPMIRRIDHKDMVPPTWPAAFPSDPIHTYHDYSFENWPHLRPT